MESEVIYLPTLKDGVISLGDLWDCRTSVPVGNLFDKPLTRESVEAYPISTMSYTLERVKDLKDLMNTFHLSVSLSLEAMQGQIKFAGKASFDRESRKKFHEEMIVCNYETLTYAIRLINPTEFMSKIVKENLEEGKSLSRTHALPIFDL